MLLASGVTLPENAQDSETIPFMGALVKMQEDAETIDHRAGKGATGGPGGNRFFR